MCAVEEVEELTLSRSAVLQGRLHLAHRPAFVGGDHPYFGAAAHQCVSFTCSSTATTVRPVSGFQFSVRSISPGKICHREPSSSSTMWLSAWDRIFIAARGAKPPGTRLVRIGQPQQLAKRPVSVSIHAATPEYLTEWQRTGGGRRSAKRSCGAHRPRRRLTTQQLVGTGHVRRLPPLLLVTDQRSKTRTRPRLGGVCRCVAVRPPATSTALREAIRSGQ
jgi:hypothetical protein